MAGKSKSAAPAEEEAAWYERPGTWIVAALLLLLLLGGGATLYFMNRDKPDDGGGTAGNNNPDNGKNNPRPPINPVRPGDGDQPKLVLKLQPAKDLSLEPGGRVPVEVTVERGDYKGPIELKIEGLPGKKVSAETVTLGEEETTGKLEIVADAAADEAATEIRVVASTGTSKAEGKLQFTLKRGVASLRFAPLKTIALSPGIRKAVKLTIERKNALGPVQFSIPMLPDKVDATLADVPANQHSAEIEFVVLASAPEGMHDLKLVARHGDLSAEITVKLVIEKARLGVTTDSELHVRPGTTLTFDVKVDRRGGYDNDVRVLVEDLPDKVTLTTSPKLPLGQDTVKVELKAAPDAVETLRQIRVVASGEGLTGEKRVNLTVSKGDGKVLPSEVKTVVKGGLTGRLDHKSKQALLQTFGGTDKSEEAVLRGLRWLARHQAPDGRWSLHQYHQAGPGCTCRGEFEMEVQNNDVAATALGVLPFLGAGVTHKAAPEEPKELAKYKDNVAAAITYLVRNQKKEDGNLGGGMYAHALGTIALCEAYGMSKDQKLKPHAQLAIAYLMRSQHQTTGGWRYAPGQEGDTSVVGWVVIALRSAEMAELTIPKNVMDGAGHFLNAAAAGPPEAKLSRYSYEPGKGGSTHTLTAVGLLNRAYLGWKNDNPDFLAGCTYVMTNLPPAQAERAGAVYYYYYATQVMHHAEGKDWQKWNERMREHLIRTQAKSGHEDGSWDPEGSDWGKAGGRIYTTSLAILTLEVYYRHLPLFREGAAKEEKPPK